MLLYILMENTFIQGLALYRGVFFIYGNYLSE